MAVSSFDSTKIPTGRRLGADFYQRSDVVQLSRELLGKVLVTEIGGQRTAGRITETEAYRAPDDRACHAWNNRRTERTQVMFAEGGRAYIFLVYGIHYLFNVVTGPADDAHAVLVRALEPLEGIATMWARRFGTKPGAPQLSLDLPPAPPGKNLLRLTVGPGALAQALGLTTALTGQSLLTPDTPVWIEDRGEVVAESEIAAGPRIGVDYAGECALWPWRFWLRDSAFVKR